MSTFEIYLIIFLLGGFVIGSMVYSGVKGLLGVMSRFYQPGYPMYGAPSVPSPAPTSNYHNNGANNSMVNWLLFITICLAAYSLMSNADIKAIKTHLEKSAITPATVDGYESYEKKGNLRPSHNYRKPKEVKVASAYSIAPTEGAIYLQLIASNRLQKIKERGNKYQSLSLIHI